MRGRIALGLALALLLAAGLWLAWPELAERDVEHRELAMSEAQIEAGHYLARAGNCVACHTVQGEPPFSGGRRIRTPFGDVYSTNLTPDEATGLGGWSAEAFYRALHYGKSRNGRRLYPAFPYPNYTRITREDSDAIFAYLQSLAPVSRAQPPPAVRFPYDTQLALMVWRALYFRPGEYRADDDRDAVWNRGAYLVEGLGHCNACHTVRGPLGGIRRAADYSGGPIPMLGWDALPLTFEEPMSEAQIRDMREVLHAGTSRRNVATGPMAEVVFHSLQHLHEDDIVAMVEYIRTLPRAEMPAAPKRAMPSVAEALLLRARGKRIYGRHCADCHGADGEGEPYVYPALAGNRLVSAPSPANAIQTVLLGGYAPSTAAHPRPYGMPSYRHLLSDAEVAAVLTYIRVSWGNDASAVREAEVARR